MANRNEYLKTGIFIRPLLFFAPSECDFKEKSINFAAHIAQ
jgi:hypothetical protein